MAKITLEFDEIRAALAKELSEKTGYTFGDFAPDECFFTVTSGDGKVDVDDITFTGFVRTK